MALLVTQMYWLLDQFAANIGATFQPNIGWVWAMAAFFIMVNSLSYVAILHTIYALVLQSATPPGFISPPKFMRKTLGLPPLP